MGAFITTRNCFTNHHNMLCSFVHKLFRFLKQSTFFQIYFCFGKFMFFFNNLNYSICCWEGVKLTNSRIKSRIFIFKLSNWTNFWFYIILKILFSLPFLERRFRILNQNSLILKCKLNNLKVQDKDRKSKIFICFSYLKWSKKICF